MCFKLCTNPTHTLHANPTQQRPKYCAKLYTKPSYITSCRSLKSPSLQGGVGVGLEKPFPSGRGWGRLPLQKSNNFEPFFGDSTLTFLTFGNTFRLPILPSRRAVLLCLPLIFLCLPLIFLCLPLIFPGCASKIPDFKGKVTKKGGEPRLLPYLSTNIILFIAKSKKC